MQAFVTLEKIIIVFKRPIVAKTFKLRLAIRIRNNPIIMDQNPNLGSAFWIADSGLLFFYDYSNIKLRVRKWAPQGQELRNKATVKIREKKRNSKLQS